MGTIISERIRKVSLIPPFTNYSSRLPYPSNTQIQDRFVRRACGLKTTTTNDSRHPLSAAMMGRHPFVPRMEQEESQHDFLLEDLMDIGLYDSTPSPRFLGGEIFRYMASSTLPL